MNLTTLTTPLIEGGPIIIILASYSIVALAVVLVKLSQNLRAPSIHTKHLDEALDHISKQDMAQAHLLLGAKTNPRRPVIQTGLMLVESKSWSTSDLKEELSRLARKAVNASSSYLRVLEVIAITAPLLGLFGTVLGMIEAFKAMEAAGAQVDPSLLSGGIWKALFTTAAGLGVAIPVSLCNSFFERRTETLAATLEDDISRLLTANHDHSHSALAMSKNA